MLNKSKLMMTAGLVTLLAACGKDKNPVIDEPTTNGGKFVIAAKPTATGSEGVADYLLTTSRLDSGLVSTAGNGIEQDGTYRYYCVSGSKFFSMLYGQGNPGAVTVYNLDANGKMQKLSNFQTETVQAFGAVGTDILLFKQSRSYIAPTSRWYQVSTSSLTITKEGELNSTAYTNNGELSHVSWVHAVGTNKVYAPYFSIKATTDGGWTTDYPDSAWIAVYNYPAMTLEKVIKDNRTSSIGQYFTDGLAQVENGDIYAFSPANTVTKVGTTTSFNSTKHSSITRIKAGTTEFDQSYLFDVEAVADGAYVNAWTEVGNGIVVATMNTKDKKYQYYAGNRLAIIDLVNQKFTWVTGIPDAASVSSITKTNYSAKDGIAYIGFNTTSGKSAVYKINAATATATRGLELEGGLITAVQYLPVTN